MYKVISIGKGSDNLSNGSHRGVTAPERELNKNEVTNRNFPIRIYWKDVFGFAERQENATQGYEDNLTHQRIIVNHVLDHRAETEAAFLVLAAKVNIKGFSWYVPHVLQ